MNFEEFYPLFCEDNGIAVGGQYSEEIEDYCLLSFQAGAASRDAEVAELKTVPMKYRRMAFNAQLQAEVAELAKERDQFRAELVKALAACKVKDEALRELDQLIPVGATIAALAIQPDDAALKAWLGEPVAWADAYGNVIRKSTKEFSRNSMTAAYSIALYSPNLPLGETK